MGAGTGSSVGAQLGYEEEGRATQEEAELTSGLYRAEDLRGGRSAELRLGSCKDIVAPEGGE